MAVLGESAWSETSAGWGPPKRVFERVDHRHLDDLLPGLPAPCQDPAQLLAGYLTDQLTRTDVPFAHLVGDVAVVDAWPDAGSRAWGVGRPGRCGFHAAHRLDGLPDGHKCRRQHGHGYQVGVQIDPAAIGTPSSALQAAEAFIRHELHQRSLNEVLGPSPTAEQLAETLGAHFVGELQIRGGACWSLRRPRRWRCGGQRRRGRERRHRYRSPSAAGCGTWQDRAPGRTPGPWVSRCTAAICTVACSRGRGPPRRLRYRPHLVRTGLSTARVGLRGLRRPGPGRAGTAHAATAAARAAPGMMFVTGGEPLVQGAAVGQLLRACRDRGGVPQVETNGTLPPRRLGGPDCWPDDFNVSPKLASGINRGADPASKRIRPKAIAELLATGRAVWRFVAADLDDLDEIDWWIERFGLPIDNVWVMPEGTSTAGLTAHTQQLAEAVLARGLSLTTRLHILVWGAERGQ